jgi:hypothetical protein
LECLWKEAIPSDWIANKAQSASAPGRKSNLADTTPYCVFTAAESQIRQPRTQPTQVCRFYKRSFSYQSSVAALFGFAGSFLCRPNPRLVAHAHRLQSAYFETVSKYKEIQMTKRKRVNYPPRAGASVKRASPACFRDPARKDLWKEEARRQRSPTDPRRTR